MRTNCVDLLNDKEQALIFVVVRLNLYFMETGPRRNQRQIGNAITPGKLLPGGLPVDKKFDEGAAPAEKTALRLGPEEHLPPHRGHRVIDRNLRERTGRRQEGGKKEDEGYRRDSEKLTHRGCREIRVGGYRERHKTVKRNGAFPIHASLNSE